MVKPVHGVQVSHTKWQSSWTAQWAHIAKKEYMQKFSCERQVVVNTIQHTRVRGEVGDTHVCHRFFFMSQSHQILWPDSETIVCICILRCRLYHVHSLRSHSHAVSKESVLATCQRLECGVRAPYNSITRMQLPLVTNTACHVYHLPFCFQLWPNKPQGNCTILVRLP